MRNKKLFNLLINLINLICQTCETSLPCGLPGFPYHGFYNVSQNTKINSFTLGSIVKYYCNSNAILFGRSKRHCFKSGRWDNKIPQCAQQLNLKNFIDSTHSKSMNIIDAIDGDNKTCFSSVSLHGQPIFHSWEILFKQNLLIKAIRLLFSSEHSKIAEVDYTLWIQSRTGGKKVECVQTKTFMFDDLYIYEHSCNGIIEGDALLVDSAKTIKFILCEVVIFALNIDDEHKCGTPDTPSNGFVKTFIKNTQKFAEFGCNEGFVLSGAKEIKCAEEGVWSALTPLCFPQKYTHKINKTKSHLLNTTEIKSNDNSIMYCRNLSETNGIIYYTYGLQVGSEARLQCNNGYHTSRDYVKCTHNGIWSDNHAIGFACEIIQCKLYNKINLGTVIKQTKNLTKANYGSVIEIVCDSDEQRINYKLRYCGQSGQWVRKADIDNKTAVSDLKNVCWSHKVTNITNNIVGNEQSKYLDMNILIIVSSIAAFTTTAILLVTFFIFLAFKRNCFGSVKSDRNQYNKSTTITAMKDFSFIEIKHNIANNRLSDTTHIYHSPTFEMADKEIETRVMSSVKFGSRRNTSFIHNYSEPFDIQSNESQYNVMAGCNHENIYSEPYVSIENEIYSST